MAGGKQGFFKPSNDMFEIGLNIYQIGVYAYLARCANNSNAFPSYKTIAEKCGISKRKAIDTVTELEQLGLLQKRLRPGEGRNQTNSYKVIFAQKGAHGALGMVHDVHHYDAHGAPNKELLEEELVEEELYNAFQMKSAHGFIETYLIYFKRKKRREHMPLTRDQLQHVVDQIEHLESYGVNEEIWETEVIRHFNPLAKGNDGCILAFIEASPRYFEIPMYNHIQKWMK